jgi:hypothetical protein
LTTDLTIECTTENKKQTFNMGLPILLFQVLFPLGMFLALLWKKRKNKINKEEITTFSKNFGYFYMDYSEKCYYWEFVRMM